MFKLKDKKRSYKKNSKTKKSKTLIQKSKKKTLVNSIQKLDNGLKYFIREAPSDKGTHIIIMVKTGAINEGKFSGLSHILEHLLFTGIKEYKNSQVLVEQLERLGCVINAFTHYETTCYYLTCHHSKLTKVMDIFSKMIKKTQLDNYRLQNEKKIVYNEIGYRKDKIKEYCNKLIKKHLFKNTVFEHIVIGTPLSLKELEKVHLHSYLVTRYKPQNMVVGIVGKLGNNSESEITKLIKTSFGQKNLMSHYEFDKTLYNYNQYTKFANYFNKINLNINKKVEKTKDKINWGYHSIVFPSHLTYVNMIFECNGLCENSKSDIDNLELQDFLNDYLDSGMSGKLFDIIREEHYLSYNLSCDIHKYSRFGLFIISFSILNDLHLIKKSLTVLSELIRNLKNKLLDEKTIAFIKLKNENRKKTRNSNYLNIGLKRAEFILFNNIKTKHFKTNYIINTLDEKNKTKKKKFKTTKKNKDSEDKLNLLKNEDINKYANELFNIKKMALILISSKTITKKNINYNQTVDF